MMNYVNPTENVKALQLYYLYCFCILQFIAVAAHPPESSYHRMGAPLTGRGIIQIWCVVNNKMVEHDLSDHQKRQKRGWKKPETAKEESNAPQKPRGRPRKNPIVESINVTDSISEEVQNVDNSLSLLSIDVATPDTCEHMPEKGSGDKSSTSELKKSEVNISEEVQAPENHRPILLQDEIGKFSSVNFQEPLSSDPARHSVSKDVPLPRMVVCLAHNGKVAWDLKWRPSNVNDKHRMGYLAVLLGNGALEV